MQRRFCCHIIVVDVVFSPTCDCLWSQILKRNRDWSTSEPHKKFKKSGFEFDFHWQLLLYKNFKFHVMHNLICDTIIGNNLLLQHKSVTIKFQGKLPELVVSTIMSVANVPYPQLFGDNLSARCKPIVIKN